MAISTFVVMSARAGRVICGLVDRASHETGFEAREGLTGAWSTRTTLSASAGAGATLTFDDTNLDPAKRYSYRVRSLKTLVDSPWTPPVKLVAPGP